MKIKIVFILLALLLHFSLTGATNARDSLYSLLLQHNLEASKMQDTTLVNVYNQLAKSYFPSYPDSIILYATRAIDLSGSVSHDQGLAEALRFMGIAHYIMARYDTALEYYFKSKELSEEIGFKINIANNYNNIAVIYDILGENTKSLEYYYNALAINREIDNKRGIAYNLINIGLIHHNQGQFTQALERQFEGLKITRSLDDKKGMALSLNNIGAIYSSLGRKQDAIEKYREAYKIRKEINDKVGMSSNLYSIGYTQLQINKSDSAGYYFDKATRLSLEANDTRGLMQILVAQGDIALDDRQFNEAKNIYNQAMKKSAEIGDRFNIARLHTKLARAELGLGNTSIALELAGTAREIGYQIDNKTLIQVSARILSEIYEHISDFQNALKYYKEHKQMIDSINNLEIQRRTARIDADYEFFKRENELLVAQQEKEMLSQARINRQVLVSTIFIILSVFLTITLILVQQNRKRIQQAMLALHEKNTEIHSQKKLLEDQKQDLEEANQAKNRLFSVISHDMKGPLAYATMAIDIVQNKDQQYSEKTLPLIKNNIDSVYQLMENLLEWSKVQMNRSAMEKKEFDLFGSSREAILAINSQAMGKEISVTSEIPKNTMLLADKSMIELVMRNLLTNAIKFSHKGSSIRIFAEENEDEIKVCTEDYGIGIAEEDIPGLFREKLVSKPGTANEKGAGLGLKLSRELLEKNDGRLWIESQQGKGTRAWFVLPRKVNRT